jgi:hypothetical protein
LITTKIFRCMIQCLVSLFVALFHFWVDAMVVPNCKKYAFGPVCF